MKKNKFEIVNISEIDESAVKSYCAIHNVPETLNLGDITLVDCCKLPYRNILANDPAEEHISECTVALVGGSPCQSFSTAGKLEGSKWTCEECGKSFDPLEIEDFEDSVCPYCGSDKIKKTESSLIAYWLKMFKEVRPQFAVFENVANITSKKFKNTFNLFIKKIENLGYNVYFQVMNSKDYGIPQNRKRLICVAIRKDVDNGKFKFPDKFSSGKSIKDLLDDCSYLFERTDDIVIIDKTIAPYVRKNIEKEINQIICSNKAIYRPKCTSGFQDHAIGIEYAPALRAHNPSTIVLDTYDTPKGKRYYIKRLTPKEAYRFMGFSDGDYEKASSVCPKTQIYKQAGNSIVVDMVYAVFKELSNAMPYLFENVKVIDLFAGIGAFEKALKRVIEEANYNNQNLREESIHEI